MFVSIENDEHNQYANMLIRSFIAHGIDNQHEIVILSPTTSSLQSRLLKVVFLKFKLKFIYGLFITEGFTYINSTK